MLRKLIAASLSIFIATAVNAAELIMVDQVGCPYCELWDRQIGPIYPKTDEGLAVPLRHMDLHNEFPGDITFARGVNFTPTFVLVEDGQELARIEGYPGEDFFWGLLTRLLVENVGFEDGS